MINQMLTFSTPFYAKTSGGVYSIDDICTGCVKEGHNILAVFNTEEDIEIVGSPGKPFEASILAPRAHVKLNGSAIYVSGYIVAASFETVGELQEDLIIKGETYKGPLDCGPTDAPTFAPTQEDKIDNTCLANDILLVNDQDTDKYKLPAETISLALDPSSPDFNKTVTFSITQKWTDKLKWMNVAYDQEAGDMYCNDDDYVKKFEKDDVKTYTAKCNEDGITTVEVFAYASMFKQTGADNTRGCSKWTSSGRPQKVARYVFDLACDGRQICTHIPSPPVEEEEDEEEDVLEGLCNFPSRTKDLSVITRGDADISASEIFSGVAIGGSLKNTMGNKVDIATQKKKTSYFVSLEDDCETYFKGKVKEFTPYTKWLDFSRFEWLAQNLFDMDRDGKRVVVLQSGGDIDLSVYNPDCDSKQSGQNFLLVFNTTEEVNLVGSADSCPYLASVLAPFSHVTLMDEAIYLDGFVVADTFETKGEFEASLRIRGNTFKGDMLCWETEAPTASPTSGPTSAPTTRAFLGTNSAEIKFNDVPEETKEETSETETTPSTTSGENKAGSNGDPHCKSMQFIMFDG